jgi:predicted alpha/beta hydrolase family esterase
VISDARLFGETPARPIVAAMETSPPILILPGIHDSGPTHWQSLWLHQHPNMRRVAQRDWHHPVCSEWAAVLDDAVRESGPQTVLVAHSLACLQLAHWAATTRHRIHAAMLVAVPDPEGPAFPKEATGFSGVPLQPFAFRSLVIGSSDDPYGGLPQARRCAAAWGSERIELEGLGHINAASGLGDWPWGLAQLERLIQAPA